jgi:hypothetical protein
MKFARTLWLCIAAGAPRAQEGFAPDPLSAAELRTTLEFLASDERGGRDSPSVGLTQARDYIVERVRAAKLSPGVGDSFLHRYTLPGVRVDGSGLAVTVRGAGGADKELVTGDDVRLWRADAEYANDDVEVVRLAFSQPGADRLFNRQRGRRPVLVEVDTAEPLWQLCGGMREQLSRGGGAGGAPWLVVRKGVLPDGELRARVHLPAPEAVEIELHNVIATRTTPGATEWVLFTAHYDHVGVGLPRAGDPIYNGADDNASGSAAVLALAEHFATQEHKLSRNLAFVWFSAEEKGLRGSRAFVAESPIPLADIAAVVNLEMLGRPPPGAQRQAWITGSDLSDFAAIAKAVFAKTDVSLVPFPMASALFNASDNLPFAQRGVVAHSVSAGRLHEDYHQPGDQLERLDYEHMSSVVRALAVFGVELATRPERPSFNAKGKAQLKLQ